MKRMISGIKPSGKLTLGNYLGAIKPFLQYQNDYELFIFIADLHALTLSIDSAELRNNISDLISTYLAAGLDISKTTIFKQSDILEHTALEWILTCNTNVRELTKMPQYKNYVEKNGDKAVPCGMLMYPSLMNADILLYDADYVPVGIDQKPHVDLTRDIAEDFNKKYHTNILKAPEPIITKVGAKIMSLSDPSKKMSKSESDKGTIYLLDDLDSARKKIMKAKTDAESKIYYDLENKAGISNLLTIYAAVKNISIEGAVNKFKDETDYGKFKAAVADVVVDELKILQEKIRKVKQVPSYINDVLANGDYTAKKFAEKKLQEIYKVIGLR